MDPIILFFIFGVCAGALKSELRLPSQIYDFVSILLLISIGLKGGIELAKQPFLSLLPQFLAVVLSGFILPFIAYPILHRLGKYNRGDSASYTEATLESSIIEDIEKHGASGYTHYQCSR